MFTIESRMLAQERGFLFGNEVMKLNKSEHEQIIKANANKYKHCTYGCGQLVLANKIRDLTMYDGNEGKCKN